MIGQYWNLIPVPVDATAINSRVPRSSDARDIAREVFSREQLHTAYRWPSEELVFYRWYRGELQVYAELPWSDREGYGLKPGLGRDADFICRIVCRGKIPMREKVLRNEWRHRDAKADAKVKLEGEQADREHHLAERFKYLESTRGMGRHYQRSHVIDKNPLKGA